jgi:hypothetical protein
MTSMLTVIWWRSHPAQVTASGNATARAQLDRFEGDRRAAMAAGLVDSDAYLGWRRATVRATTTSNGMWRRSSGSSSTPARVLELTRSGGVQAVAPERESGARARGGRGAPQAAARDARAATAREGGERQNATWPPIAAARNRGDRRRSA